MSQSLLFLLCFLGPLFLAASSYFPLKIDLKDPIYREETLMTENGGIIQGEGLYIQAQKVRYTTKKESGEFSHYIEAEKDLLIDLHGQVFLADYLVYDLEKKKGYIRQGKTSFYPWYIEASKIALHSDESFDVFDAKIGTLGDHKKIWTMQADHMHFTKDKYLSAKSLSIKVAKTPIFWLPWIKTHLGPSLETPFKYSFAWDAGQGPIASFRYKIFSYQDFNMYARFEYRYKRGPGGSLEMDYKSPDKLTFFQSKNYLCNETFYNDDNPNKRIKKFRLQGIFKKKSGDGRAEIDLIYDRYSDKNLPQDFKMDEFELNTQKQNRMIGRYFHSDYLTGFRIRPRVNGFDGYNQELPSLFMHVKPIKLSPLPLVLFNSFQLSYYDYVYSNLLKYPAIYKPVLQDFHAVRAQTRQKIAAPMNFKGFKVSPYAGFIGIGYSNSPSDHSVIQSLLDYGLKTELSLHKNYKGVKHLLRPYVDYTGLYKPLQPSKDVYIFSIDDGYHSLNFLKFGIDQHLFSKKDLLKKPFFSLDTYALAFAGDFTYRNFIPKAGIALSSYLDDLFLKADIRWNFNNSVLDFSNLQMSYTYNSNLAFHLEYRYRSAYDWRKNNHEDFILDVTRPISELLTSPLSDKRQTFITKAELKLSANWTCQLQTHHGWGRSKEPSYHEAKVNLITSLSSAWRLKLYYMYTTRGGSHAGMKIDLIQ